MNRITKTLALALSVFMMTFGFLSCDQEKNPDSQTSDSQATSEDVGEQVSETSESQETSEMSEEEIDREVVVESEHLGLIAVGSTDTVDISKLSSYAQLKLYKTGGGVEILLDETVSGDSLSLDGLNGEYAVGGFDENGNGYKIYFDVYDPAAPFEWNVVSADTAALSPRKGKKLNNTKITKLETAPQGASSSSATYFEINSRAKAESYNFTWMPLHSKAYYEIFKDEDIQITFEYCLTSASNTTTERPITGVYGGEFSSEFWKKIPIGIWFKASVDIATICERFDVFAEEEGLLIVTDGYYWKTGSPVFGTDECTSKLYVGNMAVTVTAN